jgi:hypothetical protein
LKEGGRREGEEGLKEGKGGEGGGQRKDEREKKKNSGLLLQFRFNP